MKNRTLLLHTQIVWGSGADDDQPTVPSQREQSKQGRSTRGESSSVQKVRRVGQEMTMKMIQMKESLMQILPVKEMKHRMRKRKRKQKKLPLKVVNKRRKSPQKRKL